MHRRRHRLDTGAQRTLLLRQVLLAVTQVLRAAGLAGTHCQGSRGGDAALGQCAEGPADDADWAALLRRSRGRVALAGMGKLGSFELTAGSDVDLILLYEHDDDGAESDGAKPLDPVRYFTRLTQRLIAALSAPTAEGVRWKT